jgi:alpha-glucosidase
LSGFSLNHSDVGGYSTFSLPVLGFETGYKRGKELLLRWMELGVFSSVFRTHEGSMPQSNVQFYSDSECLEHLAYCGNMFKSLKEYKKVLMSEAEMHGYPLIRTMFLEFPLDLQTWNLTNQFMFGNSLLIAPVLNPNMRSLEVYLPNVSEPWVHVWTRKSFNSGNVVIDCPLGKPGVFIKESDLTRKELQGFLEFVENAPEIHFTSMELNGLC